MSGNTAMMTNKKQREVYIGNLTIGVVNDVMLRELFNAALAHLVPDPHINPPVVSTSMDPSGQLSNSRIELAFNLMFLTSLAPPGVGLASRPASRQLLHGPLRSALKHLNPS